MNILLTGRPGIGKSTVIRRIALELGKERAGGFWSSEIRKGGRRVGFSLETTFGKIGTLAHVDLAEGPTMGKYKINLHDIDTIAVSSMTQARESGMIIIIDEIAAMELFSPSFAPEVFRCLDTGRVLGTIQMKSRPILNSIRERNDVTLIEVTFSNREVLHREVLSMMP